MKTEDLGDIKKLNAELATAMTNLAQQHIDMALQRNYYMTSAFYQRKSGDTPAHADLASNLLRVFADKNMHYMSEHPIVKVPTPAADQDAREKASKREKILYATYRKSGMPQLMKKWAYDGTIFNRVVAETTFNIETRCVEIKRYDPRYCYWQLSNDDDKRVIAFWAVFPITKEEAINRYGVSPTGNLSTTGISDPYLKAIDGKDWFIQAVRLDETHRVAWVGNEFIEEPHEHQMGGIPIDTDAPFDDFDTSNSSSYFLDPLLPLQAELNHALKQRANIVQRMSNPLVWGRGIMARQFDDIKNNLSKAGGGFVGLKQGGELGLLQVNDVKLLNDHIDDILKHMMRLSGFSAASFGESVGANTSGDALGMYFTPTQKLIEHQQIGTRAFLESINAKVLRLYDKFGKLGEEFNISGYAPQSTLMGVTDKADKMQYIGGAFNETFDKSVIAGNYISVVNFNPVTPKNEVAEKTFWLNAANQKVVSRTTAYENMGIDSPEDELQLLQQEQAEPTLNPDGTQKILQTAQQLTPPEQTTTPGMPGELPAAQPVPVGQPAAPSGY
jgi:hypothetical protein